MATRLHHGRLLATVADVVDAGVDLLPMFELAAIPVLDSTERPGELPALRRRLRAEGIRVAEHRGVLLLTPGELDRFSSVGMFSGFDELYLCAEWNDEFEPFPGRITSDTHDLEIDIPLGLEEWMIDADCIVALGDGFLPGAPASKRADELNWATLDAALADRLAARFRPVGRR